MMAKVIKMRRAMHLWIFMIAKVRKKAMHL